MSRLKKLVNTLGDVIIQYYQIQTTPEVIDKPHHHSHDFYQEIITKATKVYDGRRGFMTYLLYVMDTIAPYIDKRRPLSNEEQKLITDIITALVIDTKQLLNSHKSSKNTISYANQTETMGGFLLGVLRGYQHCQTGQIITKELIEPFGFATENSYIEYTVKELINEHQEKYKEIADVENKLRLEEAKSAALEEVLTSAQSENAALRKEIESLRQSNLFLKEETTSMTSTLELNQQILIGEKKKTAEQALEITRLQLVNNELINSVKSANPLGRHNPILGISIPNVSFFQNRRLGADTALKPYSSGMMLANSGDESE
jgi:hypothetical protein